MIDVVISPLCSLCPESNFLRIVLLRKKFGQTLKDGYRNFSTYKHSIFFRKYDKSSIHRLENQMTSLTKQYVFTIILYIERFLL